MAIKRVGRTVAWSEKSLAAYWDVIKEIGMDSTWDTAMDLVRDALQVV